RPERRRVSPRRAVGASDRRDEPERHLRGPPVAGRGAAAGPARVRVQRCRSGRAVVGADAAVPYRSPRSARTISADRVRRRTPVARPPDVPRAVAVAAAAGVAADRAGLAAAAAARARAALFGAEPPAARAAGGGLRPD